MVSEKAYPGLELEANGGPDVMVSTGLDRKFKNVK
jgi:hypothetical protein